MKIDRKLLVLILLLLGVLLLAGGLFWLNRRPAAAVEPEFSNLSSISVWGPARVSLPVVRDKVSEYSFTISPELPFTIVHSQTEVELWFDTPAEPGAVYTLSANPINAGSETQEIRWQFTPRTPEVIFMVLGEEGSDLWIISLETHQTRRLTSTNGSIQDYAVSPGGEQIIFSVKNSQNGSDLWAVERDGEAMRQVVSCGSDICTDAAFLPMNRGFSYVRSSRTPGGETTTQILLKENTADEERMLYEQNGGRVSDLNWSPNGNILAFVDERQFQIRFLFLEDLTVTAIGCQSSETGGWTADGSKMVFACTGLEQSDPCKDLKEIDPFTMAMTDSPMQELNGQRDYSPPAFSRDGKWIVFGERCFSDRPTRQLWLVDTQTQQGAQVTNEPLYNYANYHWDAASQMLVLQRYEMGSASAAPDILLWRLSTEKLELLAEDGHSPNWLP